MQRLTALSLAFHLSFDGDHFEEKGCQRRPLAQTKTPLLLHHLEWSKAAYVWPHISTNVVIHAVPTLLAMIRKHDADVDS